MALRGFGVGRLLGVVAADDGGEVVLALLFAGGDGVGVEAGIGVRLDPRNLGAQGGDLAVGAADVRARRVAARVVGGAAAAVARPVAVGVAQRGERVVVAGQERLGVLIDLEAGVGDQRSQFASSQVGPGVPVGELDGRGAVTVGGRALADVVDAGISVRPHSTGRARRVNSGLTFPDEELHDRHSSASTDGTK
ncbi:hypothetical protein [Streptomyces sp. NPDC002990]